MLVVNDSQIKAAEQILFERTDVFDEERKNFICNWSTCDLQAVPGSGKTTALLAKLILLEKNLPLSENRGVLVLSHTNTAVEEIRKRIGGNCPKLFSGPNFIGTIQSFVDRFLAIPYYTHLFKKKPIRIDDDIYKEHHHPGYTLKAFLSKRNDYEKIIYGTRLLNETTVGYAFSDEKLPFKETAKSYKDLLRIKLSCQSSGFLCFEDAYLLAFEYLQKLPGIQSIIQKRFSYVFVDEMQDMDRHQYELLEKLFDPLNSSSVMQRIGDINQAIFNEEAKLHDIWKPRAKLLKLTGSQRLQPKVATVVERLALNSINVDGLRTHPSGKPIQIKPHLLVYRDNTITKVIPKFAELISLFQVSGEIPKDAPSTFKAICWSTKKEAGKIRIHEFFPTYSKEHSVPKIIYSGLESHLYLHKDTFPSIRKSILNAILHILRKLDIHSDNNKPFTKRNMLDYLKQKHVEVYNDLKLKLYQWSRMILNGEHGNALKLIKEFIPRFVALWGKKQFAALTFINEQYVRRTLELNSSESKMNQCRYHGIPIEVDTIHGVKGQTHTATLYLESFYQKSIKKSGNYESERLAAVLKGNPLSADAHEYTKQSMKMTYVGFSRPTHLLCFAVHESRFESHLKDICTNTWEIVRLNGKDEGDS
ncbi:MAG TPA: UvrD-helicase domain-containing protein [Flavisolibacter sp.]|nr:UvrD-helicase domain-containing protein [Flavisolibacter sp.]